MFRITIGWPQLGSSDDLRRALSNLTTNAIRHTEAELLVRLEGRRTDDGHIQVAIIDSCGGIPEASLSGIRPWLARHAPGAAMTAELAWGWLLPAVSSTYGGEILVSNVEGGCRFEVAVRSRHLHNVYGLWRAQIDLATVIRVVSIDGCQATTGADKSALGGVKERGRASTPGVAVLDDLVRFGGSFEGERLDLDHQFALLQQLGGLSEGFLGWLSVHCRFPGLLRQLRSWRSRRPERLRAIRSVPQSGLAYGVEHRVDLVDIECLRSTIPSP